MLWQGAVQISLDLLRGEIVLPHGLLHEVFVVPRVRGLLIDGTWEIPTGTMSKVEALPLVCSLNSPTEPLPSPSHSKGTCEITLSPRGSCAAIMASRGHSGGSPV